MTEINDVKKGIAKMYYHMSRFCHKQSLAIENDIENFKIEDLKTGYEFKTNDSIKYQLICELKEIEND